MSCSQIEPRGHSYGSPKHGLPGPQKRPSDQQTTMPTDPPRLLLVCSQLDCRHFSDELDSGANPTSFYVQEGGATWECALTKLILAGLTHRALELVSAGANRNGYPTWCFNVARARYVRGRPASWMNEYTFFLQDWEEKYQSRIDPLLLNADLALPILPTEVQERTRMRGRFWADADFPLRHKADGGPMHALTACAMMGNVQLYEELAGDGLAGDSADESFWVGERPGDCWAARSPSSMAVQSPLDAAVLGENEAMLHFLLGRKHRPDQFNAVMPTRSMSPIVLSIAKARGPWVSGFDLMVPHSDLSLTTPMFGCHILHFAVATLDLELVWHVAEALGSPRMVNSIPQTALGHSLLHIACLPLDDTYVNLHSLPIYESMHDFRALDTDWLPQILCRDELYPVSARRKACWMIHLSTKGQVWTNSQRQASRCLGHIGAYGSKPRTPTFTSAVPSIERKNQQRVVRFLLSTAWNKRAEIARQDVHGNTILHYLSSYRHPDKELIQEIRNIWDSHDEVESRTWDGTNHDEPKTTQDTRNPFLDIRNRWGFSARDLLLNGKLAQVQWHRNFMPFWRDMEV